MKQLTEAEMLHRCAAYCSLAERCIDDIEKKLERWQATPDVRKKIILKLQKEGFIDESRFCRSFVNDKMKFNKWGKNKIFYELKKKNIPEELIQETFSNSDPENDKSRETLLQLLQSKKKSVKGKNEYEIKAKLFRFAAGRGFSSDEINDCLEKLVTGNE